MLNDSVRVSSATGFQFSSAAGMAPRQPGEAEPQDLFLDSRGMLVAMPHVPSISEFQSWSFTA